MRYLIFALIIFSGTVFGGTELDAARFDWSLGQPTIVDDNDNTTHGTRYDWSLGQPTIVREEETAAPAPAAAAVQSEFWFLP